MADSTTDRIGRLGAGTARALGFGLVLGIVLVVCGVLAVVGVDTVEVVATALVAVVFGAALLAGQGPGLGVAVAATVVYVVLRRDDIDSAGTASFAMLVGARAVAYGVVAYAGARARHMIDEAAPAGGSVDGRGLREGRATVQSPVFVFDEDGRPERAPVAAAAQRPWDGPPPSEWDDEAEPAWTGAPVPAAAGPAPWTSSPQFYAGSGPHAQVPGPDDGYGYAHDEGPASAGYPEVARSGQYPPVDPRSGGYEAVDPRSGQYPPVDPRSGGYEAVDPRSGQFGVVDPRSGQFGVVDPRSGQFGVVDPRSGQFHAVDPRSGEYLAVDPRSGRYEAVDPRTGGYPAAGPPGPGPDGSWGDPAEQGWSADDGRGLVPGAGPAAGLGLTPSGRWDRVADASGEFPTGHWAGPPPAAPPGAWGQVGGPGAPGAPGAGVAGGALAGAAAGGRAVPSAPPVDPETRLWSARYLCDRLATEQQAAERTGHPFSLVLVQVPDGPLAALSYRRQVTLLRELGHLFVAGGDVDHLVHVPDQTQHWFAVVLPGADRHEAQQFERRLRDGVGGYLRSRGLLLSDLESASLTSPDDDEAMGAIWEGLIARGDSSGAPELAFDY